MHGVAQRVGRHERRMRAIQRSGAPELLKAPHLALNFAESSRARAYTFAKHRAKRP